MPSKLGTGKLSVYFIAAALTIGYTFAGPLYPEADQILRQLGVVSPAIQDYTNGLMKKYLGR